MVIGICVFVSTGSSALCDYLKEYPSVSAVDRREFNIAYFPDGLEDLDYHLNVSCSKYMSSVAAIERFRLLMDNFFISCARSKEEKAAIEALTERFLDRITQTTWTGWGDVDLQTIVGQTWAHGFFKKLYHNAKKVNSWRSRKRGENLNSFPAHKMAFSVRPEGFDEAARDFIRELLAALHADFSKTIMLDQPFSGNNPASTFKYFDDPMAVVVDRDPRDQYLFTKKFLFGRGRMIPSGDVKAFVTFYRGMREGQPYLQENPRILRVQFEDMVYQYEPTAARVAEFLHLNPADRTKRIFVPEMSMNNTQMFKRFPEYQEEIRYIEKELEPYLYPFERYGDITPSGQMFCGRSPLNKD